MPFNSQGIYSPASGATTAFPGQVIASATWNGINADYTTALTSLGERSWVNGPRVISSPGSFTIVTTDTNIFVQTSAPTITLPLSSTKTSPVRVMGAATSIFSGHNSVIVTTSSDKLSGQSTMTLTLDYQIATFYPLPSGGYVVSYG